MFGAGLRGERLGRLGCGPVRNLLGLLGCGQGLFGPGTGLVLVAGNRVGAGQGLVGIGQVPVTDAAGTADLQAPAGVVQCGFGPAQYGVDA